MSREGFTIPPILAFADPSRDLWGVLCGREPAAMALGSMQGAAQVTSAELRSAPDSGDWVAVTGDGELTATPERGVVNGTDDDAGLFLARVSGGPAGPDADSAGAAGHPGWPGAELDSVRLLLAWFSPEQALALTAARPRKARGQDKDEVAVACLGEPDGLTAFDPRLSSTYGESGLLRRVGVEVWLGEDEEADLHSLRIGGEATADGAARLELPGVRVQAQPLVCHSRGETGAGVYVLITPA